MKKTTLFQAIALSLLLFTTACGQGQNKNQSASAETASEEKIVIPALASEEQAQLKKTFISKLAEEKMKEEQITQVSNTPIPGVYEFVIENRDVLYTDKNINYVFMGELFDVKSKTSLTNETRQKFAQQQETKINFNSLPKELAIKEVRGKGTMEVIVFADPNCSYCKKLEQLFAKIDDITVYTFLIPVLGPESEVKSKQILCSKDKTTTWINWMRKDQAPKDKDTCKTPIDELKALGQGLNIDGTPAVIFPNGKMVSGMPAQDEAELRKIIADNQK